jgi:hypothetical protein
MERCPCCNARLGGAAQCPRCQADLGSMIAAEQSARFWLSKAMQHLQDNETGQSARAVALSLHLKKTGLALVFRDFLIHQQCQEILALLAQKQLLSAKQRLYSVRNLFPHSQLLQQLNAFTDHLLVQNQ